MPFFSRPWMRRCFRIAHVALACLGLIVVAVLFSPFVRWYAKALAGPWRDPSGDIMIVLAGEDSYEGILGNNTYLRCMYAVLAWRRAGFRRVIVSGGDGTAFAMRDFLVYHGVPAARISVDPRASSTRENALFTRAILAGNSGQKLLVTSDYHAFRARRVFRRAGLEVSVFAFPDAAKRSGRLAGRMPAFINEAAETGKIVYYFARGWM